MSDPGPATPDDNPAVTVFRRYYAELNEALSGCPNEAATTLYSAGLITRADKSRAVGTLGNSPHRQADILMEAAERTIATANNAAPLRTFCHRLQRDYGVDSILAKMKLRLDYVEEHHGLPNEDWSSDNEEEQEVTVPAQEDQLPLVNTPSAMVYSHYLKDLYKRQRRTTLKWPQVIMRDFVNLLCIEHQAETDERTREHIVHGRLDKVEKERKQVQLSALAPLQGDDFSNCILVQGAPGSGKTMLSREMCQRWGQGKILQHYPMVVMLPLRDPDFQNASSLEHLFPHDDVTITRSVVAAVKQSAGKGVLFVLDGLDELPAFKRRKESFWMNLITGQVLSLATVMVTSRPWALKPLVREHSSHISQSLEIVGFTSDNVDEYIHKAFPGAEEKDKFHSYLSAYPHLRSTMCVPLNCAIVVEVYRSSGSKADTPKTMTQLYKALVLDLLQRYRESHPTGPSLGVLEYLISFISQPKRLRVFQDIPFNVYKRLYNISQLAFQGLSNNHQLIFSDLPADFETLGLLQQVFQLHRGGKQVMSYNFLHLTVQEFLAAYYITLRDPCEQQQLLRQLTNPSAVGSSSLQRKATESQRILNSAELVDRFVAGLTECKDYPVTVPVTINKEDLNSLHLLFESQNKDLTTSKLGDSSIVRMVDMDSLSSLDAYVLGYCISQSSCQWKLFLKYIGDEHAKMIKRAIESWEPGEGKIIEMDISSLHLANDVIGTLLSLPNPILSKLSRVSFYHTGESLPSVGIGAHRLASFKQHLKVLKLSGYEVTNEDAQLFSQSLCVNNEEFTTLEELYLSRARIKDGVAGSLINTLQRNTCLRVLDLSSNEIGCGGAELLSECLRRNSTLQVLELRGNAIKERGGCALAEAIATNRSLQSLGLDENPLGKETTRQLVVSLQHNCSMKVTLPREWKNFARRCDGYSKVEHLLPYF